MRLSIGKYPSLDWIKCSATDERLLPVEMRTRDNSRRLRHCERAVQWGMQQLRPNQQDQIRMLYIDGLRRAEIARELGVSDSWISRSLRASEESLRKYARLYMDIYDELERELLCDEQ